MVFGVDISGAMVSVAKHLNPHLEFRVDDMRRLNMPDATLAGAVLFYSIVHFEAIELRPIFVETRRVMAPGGVALVAFHVGEHVVHVDDLFGAAVSLDFRFHCPSTVIEALRSARFDVTEHVEREPYEGAEYPSRRCYLLARAA